MMNSVSLRSAWMVLGGLLVVAYTYRDEDTIRIISAREANAIQRNAYLG